MSAWTALVMIAFAAGAPVGPPSHIEPQESFGHVQAFRVRADLHTRDAAAAAALKPDVEAQVAAALRRHGIAQTRAAPLSRTDATADLIIDVHLLEVPGGSAVAWSFHVSQMVRLATGETAFAATWLVGDLVYGPVDGLRERLRDSLEPALEEFCAAHLATRRAPRKHQELQARDSGAAL